MDTNSFPVATGKVAAHTATCPARTVAVSGGYSVEKNVAPISVIASFPQGDKWRVAVRNMAPDAQTIEIVVYVGCMAR